MQGWTDAELVEEAKTVRNPHVPSFENPADHSHLPFVDTRFVGRETELEAVLAHLEQARLISLVGPGGIGKTRLAIQVARKSLDRFADGVYFISLLTLHTPEALPAAIFRGMHAPCYDPDVKASLLGYLRDKSTLLVLDNFEHLLPHVTLLREIAEQCPQVRLLVTSRERLNMHVEWTLPVAGLHFPETDTITIGHYSAVQLFLQSAQKACVDFTPKDEEKPSIMHICQLVQGHPLAIELAAAWTRTLSCREIAQEITRDVDFLATTWRDFPTRHQSIRTVFEYSWSLLTAEESRSFLKLQVFQGSFHRDAALHVAGVSLRTLAALVDKSFLSWNTTTQRYEIHELLRQYAGNRLESNLLEQLRIAHCAYFSAYIHQQLAALLTGNQIQTLQNMREELANLMAAWQWAAGHGQTEQIGQCSEGLYHFYEIQGWFREGHAVFAGAIAALRADSRATGVEYTPLIAKLSARQGRFSYVLGMYEEAETLAQTSLEIFLASGQTGEAAFCLISLAEIAMYHTQTAQMHAHYRHALDLARGAADRVLQAQAMCGLGISLLTPETDRQAIAWFEQGRELYHLLNHRRGEAMAWHCLGAAAVNQGVYGRAKHCYEQALQIRIETGDRRGQNATLNNLGVLFIKCGGYDQAEVYFERALSISREIGHRSFEVTAMHNLGCISRYLGRNQKACEYYRHSLRFNEETQQYGGQACTLLHLGHALSNLGALGEARAVYQRSLEIRRAIGENYQVAEVLAGLARLSSGEENLPQAMQYVEEILASTQNGESLVYADEPLQIYLICYEVLHAARDARAISVLNQAHQRLQQQADLMDDPALRRSLLENVQAHREIRQHYALLTDRDDACPADTAHSAASEWLTTRESEILALMNAGLSNKEIAGRLFISLSTVKHHIWHIYGKLDAQSRTQAIKRARELGILTL